MRLRISAFLAAALGAFVLPASWPSVANNWSAALLDVQASPTVRLQETRSSPLDLEVGGDLAGVAAGATRYIPREDLLKLAQVTFNVSDDANFTGPTQVTGVPLETILLQLSAKPQSDLVVAICDDLYRANYPRAYIAAHHPVLALLINGKEPKDWPKDSEGYGLNIGPYLISHRAFVAGYSVLGHAEQPHIPWGVVRLEFRNEAAVFNAIQPRGGHASDAEVQNGYRLAQNNCFRCHNMGAEGGQKAGHPWQVLAAWASASPEYFAAYIKDPKSKNSHSQMPGNPDYDSTALQALTAYFRTFAAPEKP
jgi:mono/diheme cytochrome c family protein